MDWPISIAICCGVVTAGSFSIALVRFRNENKNPGNSISKKIKNLVHKNSCNERSKAIRREIELTHEVVQQEIQTTRVEILGVIKEGNAATQLKLEQLASEVKEINGSKT